MKRTLFILGAGVAVCVAMAIQPAQTQSTVPAQAAPTVPVGAPAPARTAANVPMPTLTPEEQAMLAQRFSPERLTAIRARLQADAQRAVRDDAEGGYREPTAAEADVLASPATDSAQVEVALPRGGAALKADASSLTYATLSVERAFTTAAPKQKGGRDVQ